MALPGERAGPRLLLASRRQPHDHELATMFSQRLYPRRVFAMGAYRPAYDVVRVGQDRAKRRLAKPVPQLRSLHRPPQRSPDDPRCHQPSRHVKKDHKIGTFSQQRPGGGVLPLGDPLVSSGQRDDVVAKRRTRLPTRAVVKGVKLHIRHRQVIRDPPCKRRLANTRRARHQDPPRPPRQCIRPLQDRHFCKRRAVSPRGVASTTNWRPRITKTCDSIDGHNTVSAIGIR